MAGHGLFEGRRAPCAAAAGAEPPKDLLLGRIGGSGPNAPRGRLAGPFEPEGSELRAIPPRQILGVCCGAAKPGRCLAIFGAVEPAR